MSTELQPTRANPYVIHFEPVLKKLSDEDFFDFCQANRDWRIERTSYGDIIIMPPTGGETGRRHFALSVSFGSWARADRIGVGFDSSTVFSLPSGAKRSPDLAWLSSRIGTLSPMSNEEGFRRCVRIL